MKKISLHHNVVQPYEITGVVTQAIKNYYANRFYEKKLPRFRKDKIHKCNKL
jgi:hypothetical protein